MRLASPLGQGQDVPELPHPPDVRAAGRVLLLLPHGGDCFALVFEAKTGRVSALNGSGRSPTAFTLAKAQRLGLEAIPLEGPLPVTVPGTVSGWTALLDRFGTMSLAECLAPAIATAEAN